jgi:micrococcal nuclease
VTDGDTIRVAFDGQEFPVRYIGIDTPETVHPSQPVEWMGREASAANSELVAGRVVVLEKDVSETDQYGRLLRYVWLPDDAGWLLVNLELVRRGFAQVSTYPPDVAYTDFFLDAQREARNHGLGLWGEPPVDEEPPEVEPPDEEPDDEPDDDGGGGACDPSYPDVCIPPYPPDLDCGQIAEKRFTVTGPDEHGFDGDHDGVGCEG